MDFHDRNTILNEIHGVDIRGLQETPELISNSLLELQGQVQSMVTERPNLKTFVFREEYAIRFLRREFFDIQKAAIRMVKNLEYLEAYFGPEILNRNLTLQDLGKEETKLLKDGCLQVLPSRDRVGRRIIAWVGNFGLGYSMVACVSRTKDHSFFLTRRTSAHPFFFCFSLSDTSYPVCLFISIRRR